MPNPDNLTHPNTIHYIPDHFLPILSSHPTHSNIIHYIPDPVLPILLSHPTHPNTIHYIPDPVLPILSSHPTHPNTNPLHPSFCPAYPYILSNQCCRSSLHHISPTSPILPHLTSLIPHPSSLSLISHLSSLIPHPSSLISHPVVG